eukprot:TRINITY_DN25010_c0_g2_i1.p1 TRINITY_DN25010_c0_g2~~TRINITY_DN25010_c0_g2_i1.p1  ORF type:complete len:551 (-),score=76.92 TRINITY_DN25010_c0_g2_i1:1396-3048(-)
MASQIVLFPDTWYPTLLTRNYGHGWVMKHGFRELYQNLVDAAVASIQSEQPTRQKSDFYWTTSSSYGSRSMYRKIEHRYMLPEGTVVASILWDEETQTVTFTNPGRIPISALFFHPNKNTESLDIAGSHGEGLKMALLVLLREGKTVKVMPGGSQEWQFCLQNVQLPDGETTLETMCFQVTAAQGEQSVSVAIGNITQSCWEEAMHQFLDLRQPADVLRLPASRPELGSLLVGPRALSELYVKGIFVKNEGQGAPFVLHFGFDLVNIKLGRDRDAVADLWERHRCTSKLVADIMNHADQLAAQFSWLNTADLLSKTYDALCVNDHTLHFFHEHASTEVKNRIFLTWRQRLGFTEDDEVQPVLGGKLRQTIREEILSLGVAEDFYPYSAANISSLLWSTITLSTYYETLQSKVRRKLEAADVVPLSEEQRNDVSVAIAVLGPEMPPNATVHFKLFDGYSMRYKSSANGQTDFFLSNQILNYDAVVKNDIEIVCVRRVAAKIFLSLALMNGSHFGHMLVAQRAEFRLENGQAAGAEHTEGQSESFEIVPENE